MKHIYLDYNASTPLAAEVRETIVNTLDQSSGNPSASHWAGIPAKKAVENARLQVTELISAECEEIIFTSGGTEANNHALKGVWDALGRPGSQIITTTIEHPAILEPCRYLKNKGAALTWIGVDEHGVVDPAEIEAAITEDTILISVMHANNETGSIQPLKEISSIAKKYGVLLHCDAAQSIGKIPVHVDELGVDLLSVAGHKLYAPKGVGALYVRSGTPLESFMHGAGHERGRRAGTENVILAAALGRASELALEMEEISIKWRSLTDFFFQQLKRTFGEKVQLNGHPDERLPNTLNVSFLGEIGQEVLARMPEVAASTGASCHSDIVQLSPVLRAMGISEERGKGAIRFSLGRASSMDDIEYVIKKLKEIIEE
ncbi:cysteine desulfurase family protein [Alteribacillus sp. HJP-4]|uniref:cysteine desulfurase family protein n=1 Tax=Alteribacillus sp. HJP-4 TaxID=2775394 RepID=UPI0035CCD9B7